MKHYLIPENGQFYKANLHTHTTCSDGCKSPAEIKEIYMAQGYSVVAFTDHEVMIDHSDLSDESFLAITAYEVDTGLPLAHCPESRRLPRRLSAVSVLFPELWLAVFCWVLSNALRSRFPRSHLIPTP